MAITRLNNNSITSITALPSGVASDVNTPYFRARLSDFSASTDTWYKIAYSIEDYDTDGCYDTSNYRFTPTTAGKYFFMASFNHDMGGNNFRYSYIQIKKNGTDILSESYKNKNNGYNNEETDNVYTIVTMNGTTDYVEAYGYGTTANAGGFWFRNRNGSGQFLGFKLTE